MVFAQLTAGLGERLEKKFVDIARRVSVSHLFSPRLRLFRSSSLFFLVCVFFLSAIHKSLPPAATRKTSAIIKPPPDQGSCR